MNRRGFLSACLAACAAPAIVRANVLMPVRTLHTRPMRAIWHGGAGNRDWGDSLNWANGFLPVQGGDVLIADQSPVADRLKWPGTLILPDGLSLNSIEIQPQSALPVLEKPGTFSAEVFFEPVNP